MITKGFTRTPVFWILFTALSILGLYFSYLFFPRAFPIVDLNITMDRHAALKKAQELDERFKWGPFDYSQAASFDVDAQVQYFIELEGGGPEAFGNILKEKYYAPYTWAVRHFKEQEPTETKIYFTPEGVPYGFAKKISQQLPGAALSQEQAHSIAIQEASQFWYVDFSLYQSVEESQEVTPSGRIDHTFVFERTDKKIADAPYRLKLVVSGDVLTELKLSVKVPERFTRKYEEMRSLNEFISLIAFMAMVFLYVFGGCLIGFYYLLRTRWLLWRPAFIWGLVIGIFQAANTINQIPLMWFHYDTAVSLYKFLGLELLQVIIQFLISTSLATTFLMVAESLTRKAFPHKIQLWRLWSPAVGSSWQALGRTLCAYLMLGIDFAYVIIFYYCALHYFGWWSPSETLYNPNVLAMYFPWLHPIAASLSAGFLEETLLRAIPLAGAALLGKRFGKKNLWIIAAFILQAVIFSAAHANYPAQPAYARLIELLIPSTIFGLLYLCCGLMTAILLHFIYDVVWFALPIFISKAPEIWLDKILIIALCLLPLVVIFYRWSKARKWHELDFSYYNAAWYPPHAVIQHHISKHEEPVETVVFSHKKKIILSLVGFGGFMVWLLCTQFSADMLPLVDDRSTAIAYAQEVIGLSDTSWTPLIGVETPSYGDAEIQHIYVWRTLGKTLYNKLLASYLMPTVWKVRLVTFEGPVDERAQEYKLYFNTTHDKSALYRFEHVIPESKELESLSVDQIKQQAVAFIQEKYGLLPDDLKEISLIPTKQPHRIDWTITYSDIQQTIGSGQARIKVQINGNQLADSYRSVFVPEQWERDFKDEKSFIALISIASGLIFYLLLILASSIVITYAWQRGLFNIRFFILILCALFIKSCIQMINILPTAAIAFNTTEPYSFQLWRMFGFWLIYAFFKAFMLGILAGFMYQAFFKSAQFKALFFNIIAYAAGIGAFLTGSLTLLKWLVPHTRPLWPEFTAAGAYIPALSEALTQWTFFIETAIYLLLIYTAIDYITDGWKKRHWFAIIFFILFSLIGIDLTEIASVWLWLFIGVSMGIILTCFYAYAIRFMRSGIVIMAAVKVTLHCIQQISFAAYSGAILGGLLAIVLIISSALYGAYSLQRAQQ